MADDGPGQGRNKGGEDAPDSGFGNADQLSGLSTREQEQVQGQSRPSAALINETIRAEGEGELERSVAALLLSGLAAGLSMGFSLVAQGVLHQALPDASWRPLVSGLGYTVGFLIVVLGRQQLFTENTLTPVLPLLHNRDARTLWRLLRLWTLVLAANLADTWIFAAALAHTSVFDAEAQSAFAALSHHTIAHPFGTTLLKAVFAGWLIALMVWLMPAAESARALVILILTYLVSIAQLAHVIAGSVEAFYLVETGAAGWGGYGLRFLLPTLLGNVFGGVALVAALNYGQVAPEIQEHRD